MPSESTVESNPRLAGQEEVQPAAPQAQAEGALHGVEAGRRAPARSGFNWFRFWMQMLAAMIVFNIVAGLLTWYYIFPRLHPTH
jgi:hypothetical protein